MALPSLSLIFCSRLIYYHHRRRKKLINKKTENTMCIVLFFNQLSWGMQANQPKGTQGADYKKTITNQQLTSSLWRFTRGWIWWIVILTTAQKMKFLVRGITDDAASLCVSKLDPIMKSFYQSMSFYNHFIHWTVQVTSQSFQAQLKNAVWFACNREIKYLSRYDWGLSKCF